jgi:hypothetical protein
MPAVQEAQVRRMAAQGQFWAKKKKREVLNHMIFRTKVDRKEVTKFYCK